MRLIVHLLLLLCTFTTSSYAAVPAPAQILGFAVGTDRRLADWSQIREYFLRLDAASDRVVTQELGETTLGKPMLLAVISSPGNLRRLEEYRKIQAFLADPRIKEEKPEALIEAGKVVVLVTCGIHSTEVASPLTAVELAYNLARSRAPETLEVLDRVILLLVPSLNPDGTTLVAEWYRKTLGTPAEGTSPPELYHPYTGHDNNRDWFMFTQKETRLLVEKVHQRWHPQIVVDLHQMGTYGARLFIPPFIDPIDPNVDPILQAEIADLGTSILSSLVRSGRAGVVTNAIFDAFTPARAYQHYHGGIRILMEAASARLASPITISPAQLKPLPDFDPNQASWNFPLPWQPGTWRIGDVIAYQKEAVEACLLHAARYHKEWLRGFRKVGENACTRRRPYAFIIPADQKDRQSLLDLLEVLRLGQVEVHSADSDFQVPAKLLSAPYGDPQRSRFPRRSFVVKVAQPYGAFAKTLLERQNYRMPAGKGVRAPYDVTGHTLGLLLGVEVYQADQPFDPPLTPVTGDFRKEYGTEVLGEGPYCLFSHENNAFAVLVNRFLKGGASVSWAPNGFQADGKGFPVGTFMARFPGDTAALRKLAEGLPVTIERMSKAPQLAWQELRSPRIAVYQSYDPSSDEGWTRWVLEKNEFGFQLLTDKNLRTGDLTGRDIIVLCSQDPKSIVQGLSEPYPEEYRGGIGTEGLARLKTFAQQGGVLLLLGEACGLAKQMGLEIDDLTTGLDREHFYIPGTLLRTTVNNRHPIGYGMAPEAAAMFDSSPFFDSSRGLAVVRYASQGTVLSGWARGENLLSNQSGLTELRTGQGAVILIGFRTQFRAQARATFKFLFNCLYYATTFRS
ncbi:MAG: M14 metallopeptidase family protein [Acidobacteriota bacterium]